MSSNKQAKRTLILKYGKNCFIEELGIRTKEEVQEEMQRYTSKKQRKIMDELTYHHIVEKRKGGRATEQNGAILRNINHQWFNRLPKEKQDEINQMFQDYKKRFVLGTAQISSRGIEQVQEIELPEITEDCLEIEAEIMTAEEKAMYEEYKRKRAKKEFSKFGARLETPEERWKREQQEIIEDVLEELRY